MKAGILYLAESRVIGLCCCGPRGRSIYKMGSDSAGVYLFKRPSCWHPIFVPASFFIIAMLFRWGFQVKVLSKVTPSYVGVSWCGTSASFSFSVYFSFVVNVEKQVISVFVLLMETSHSFAHLEMQLSVSWILYVAVVRCSEAVPITNLSTGLRFLLTAD